MVYSIQDKVIYGSFSLCVTVILHAVSYFYFKQRTHIKEIKNRKYVIALSSLMLIFIVLFCAFRSVDPGFGGTDTTAYMEQFSKSGCSFVEQVEQFKGWEPLHYTSLWIVRRFTSDFRVYLCLYNTLFSLLLIKYATMFNLNRYHFLSTITLMLFMLSSFNTQRNTFAVFLALFIVDAIINNQYVKSIVLTFFTAGIHFSAGVWFFPIAAFVFVKYIYGDIRIKYYAFIICALSAAGILGNTIQLLIGGGRLSTYSREGSIAFGLLISFLVIILVLKANIWTINADERLYKLSLIFIAFAPAFILQLYYAIAYRLLLHSLPILYALIAEYKNILYKHKNDVTKLAMCAMLNLILAYRIILFFWGDFSDVGSYSNILLN